MNKNIIQFIVDENGQYISIPVGRVKAKSNLTTRIQLVTPITASVAVNYLIYDSKNINKKQYLIQTGDLGSAVVDPNNPNYQLVAGWKVYEADIYAPVLSVISKYRTGKVGMSFEFVEQVPNALCTNFVDYFGFMKQLPETANNGDYFICEDYNFWLNDKLYNKGDILVWYNEQWNDGGILPKALTETVDISVDPAISYPTEEVDETAFGNAIGELAEDVAELKSKTNALETNLNDKQDKVDLELNTTVKTVVGGINELKTQVEALNTNKLDKNFNSLVERTFAQLTDWVAVRSGNDTLKMSLETLKTYLTQGLVGLSFVLVDELPPTGVAGVVYLVPMVEAVVHVPTYDDLPREGGGEIFEWNQEVRPIEDWRYDFIQYQLTYGGTVSYSYEIVEDLINPINETDFYGITSGEFYFITFDKKIISKINAENVDHENKVITGTIQVGEFRVAEGPNPNYMYVTDDNGNRYSFDEGLNDYVAYNKGFNEYIWLEELNKYELIGSTQVDLTGYATELWVAENFATQSWVYDNFIINNQGYWNAGKFLGVDRFGLVYPIDLPIREIQVNGETQEPVDGVVDISTTTTTISLNGIEYLRDPDKTYLVIKTPADNDTFTLLTKDSGSPNYTIDWGDGTTETITTTASPSHEYATAGMYLITISGNFANGISVGISSNPNKDKIIEVYGGSNYPLSIGNFDFYNCKYLTIAHFPNVTNILDRAFQNCTSLTTANFPWATSIGGYAFQNCTSLITAKFPNATIINPIAFSGCTSLTIVDFPKVTSVYDNAFDNCTSLTTANIPNVTIIGSSAFRNCTSLTTAHFPNVTNIGFSAFNGCTSLITGNFPNVTSINNYAFQGCTSLKELTIGNVTTTDTGTRFENVKLTNLTIAQDATDADIERIKQFYIDNGGTFSQSCEIKYELQVEKIPTLDNDVVRKVDLDAVKNLIPTGVNLYFTEATQTLFGKSFRIMQQDKPTDPIANIDTNISATTQAEAQILARFTTVDGLSTEINLPPQNTEVHIQANKIEGNQNIRIFARGYLMDVAGNETLLSTSNVATLTNVSVNHILQLPIPAYTAPVGSRVIIEILAFRVSGSGTHTARIRVNDDTMSKWSYNLSLDNLKLDAKNITYNNITSGLSADNVQDALDELESTKQDELVSGVNIRTINDISLLGSGDITISGDGTINGIDFLKDPEKTYLVVKIPIDNDTFTLLTGNTGTPNYTIEWGDGVSETITDTSNPTHEYSKAGMYLITISGDFANGIIYGASANENKNKIIEVYGGSNYPTSISGSAFNNCKSLTTANFPNVTSIGVNAFLGCTNLITVNFLNATNIGSTAFTNCTSLTTVNFPNATSIGDSAFANCTSLTTANFPKVISIDGGVFYNCTNLIIANFPNATSIGDAAFGSCTSLKELTIGNVTTTDAGNRFLYVKLVNLTIAQDVDTADINRIKQFYADNGGTFTGAKINSI